MLLLTSIYIEWRLKGNFKVKIQEPSDGQWPYSLISLINMVLKFNTNLRQKHIKSVVSVVFV